MTHPVVRDHYQVLGVTPTSDGAAIRAAYRALMRRYHPDADSSAQALDRAREINAAYAVLGDPEKKARYDGSIAAQRLIKPHPMPVPVSRRILSGAGPAAALAIAGVAGGMVWMAMSLPIGSFPLEKPERAAPSALGQTSKGLAARVPSARGETGVCASSTALQLIKEEMIRRARLAAGADGDLVERALREAALRLDEPSRLGTNNHATTGCAAWVAVDLPAEMTVDGGRANLNDEIEFHLTGTGPDLRVAALWGAESLIRSLATLSARRHEGIGAPQDAPQPSSKAATPESFELASKHNRGEGGTNPTAGKPPAKVASDSAFEEAPGCAELASWADQKTCGSKNLAALDRQLSLLYGQSWREADASRRLVLQSSRRQFQDHRSACRSEACLTSAYLARLREISEIMARRPQP